MESAFLACFHDGCPRIDDAFLLLHTAKDGNWTEQEELMMRIGKNFLRYGSRKISCVEWEIPDGFCPVLRDWKILALYDQNAVRIFAEGSFEQDQLPLFRLMKYRNIFYRQQLI